MEVPSLNVLLCGSPNIEILELSYYARSLDKICVTPSLKRLKINIENDVGAYLEINAPNLEYLNITRITFGEDFSMYNLHNVVEAHLNVIPESFGSIVHSHNLFSALSGTKHLVLSHSTTKWLLGELHNLLFQEFQYLLHLELILPWVKSNSLVSLLQKCPLLQVLILQNDEQEQPLLLGWDLQPSVPNCLVSHLKFIQYKGCRGFSDEVLFLEYVLRNGLVLKTMIVSDLQWVLEVDPKKKYDILKRLTNLPKASGMCQLTFDP